MTRPDSVLPKGAGSDGRGERICRFHEYDDRFALFVDLPGVDPNQVEITLLSFASATFREVPVAGTRAAHSHSAQMQDDNGLRRNPSRAGDQ